MMQQRQKNKLSMGLLLLYIAIVNSSCMGPGKISITMADKLGTIGINDGRIILLEPQIKIFYYQDDAMERNYQLEHNVAKYLPSNYLSSASKHKLNLTSNNNDSLIGSLNLLQQNMLNANSLQYSSLNDNKSHNTFDKSLFADQPIIHPKHVELAQKTASDFAMSVSLIRINTNGAGYNFKLKYGFGQNTYLVMILADLKTGKIVYKEVRKLTSNLKEKHVAPVIYNALGNLKNAIK